MVLGVVDAEVMFGDSKGVSARSGTSKAKQTLINEFKRVNPSRKPSF